MNDKSDTSDAPLTPKQRRFVEEYCVDFNATQAAKRAGYSDKTAHAIGWENLRKPDIAQAISERLSALALTADEALMHISKIAREGLRPFLERDESGRIKIDLESAQAYANRELLQSVEVDGERVKIKGYDRLAALEKILRGHGVFIERHRVDFGDMSKFSDEDLKRIAAGKKP